MLHGIFRTTRSMQGLSNFLANHGYLMLNVGYPFTREDLAQLARHIHPQIEAFTTAVPGRLHIVGYSMVGMLVRAYLKVFMPRNLGTVVLLATPNQGSEVADFLKNWALYRKLYKPAGQQLATDFAEAAALFGDVAYETGILAGTRTIDPVSSWIIGKPNDGKVSVESTKLHGVKDHAVLKVSHTFFPSSRKVWRQALHFLEKGRFAA